MYFPPSAPSHRRWDTMRSHTHTHTIDVMKCSLRGRASTKTAYRLGILFFSAFSRFFAPGVCLFVCVWANKCIPILDQNIRFTTYQITFALNAFNLERLIRHRMGMGIPFIFSIVCFIRVQRGRLWSVSVADFIVVGFLLLIVDVSCIQYYCCCCCCCYHHAAAAVKTDVVVVVVLFLTANVIRGSRTIQLDPCT